MSASVFAPIFFQANFEQQVFCHHVRMTFGQLVLKNHLVSLSDPTATGLNDSFHPGIILFQVYILSAANESREHLSTICKVIDRLRPVQHLVSCQLVT